MSLLDPEFQAYGDSLYGYDLYGDGAFLSNPPLVYATPGKCPDYLRFQFSGINLGLYVFEINPSKYDVYPQRNTQSYKTILDFDPTSDEEYNKIEINMSWDQMSAKMYADILPYSRKKVDGSSEQLYFWDANVRRFFEGQIKVEALHGELRAGFAPPDRFNVSLRLREI